MYPDDPDSEIQLLLTTLDSALRALSRPESRADSHNLLRTLENALHAYGSVKHLLPKLGLESEMRAPVEARLQQLRTAIVVLSSEAVAGEENGKLTAADGSNPVGERPN